MYCDSSVVVFNKIQPVVYGVHTYQKAPGRGGYRKSTKSEIRNLKKWLVKKLKIKPLYNKNNEHNLLYNEIFYLYKEFLSLYNTFRVHHGWK